ncbi:hypothetical protein QFZ94_000236 [Paraburkholderia sp. JPY465]
MALPHNTRVVVSYEAGQDAFWICRVLQAVDFASRVKGGEGVMDIVFMRWGDECDARD